MTTNDAHGPAREAGEAGTAGAVPAPGLAGQLIVPLNRLKVSPRNARKTPHSAAAMEALAASIRASGVLQPPVVEAERDGGGGAPTGAYLVTIGEGRRQALRLLRSARRSSGSTRCG